MSQDERFYRDQLTSYDAKDATFYADLYPSRGVKYIQIGLEHVRASDDIRVSFDFGRNGFVIEMSRWTGDDQTGRLWQEVAFVGAWSLDERKED